MRLKQWEKFDKFLLCPLFPTPQQTSTYSLPSWIRWESSTSQKQEKPSSSHSEGGFHEKW